MTTSANDTQVGGAHYRTEYQHWDYATDTAMHPVEYALTKYATRYRSKNGRQDLEKAVHCAEKLVELASGQWPKHYSSGATEHGKEEWPLCHRRFCAANDLSQTASVLLYHVASWAGPTGALAVLYAAQALLAEWDAEHGQPAEDTALPPACETDGEGSSPD